ncbi:MurR/RpiR family transcriptional regulator [Enterococcus gilvus]|uniref:MurR/RpiR family transcriptional regulator n=1 Tax=Enterococcus gilvus TaxID=160453 RepID=UPI001C8C445A|nr:MurR/RpiR family transcriptional regulator [Enterococcus gilvus]MBX8938022.1 MurR/RpiR family transcriptional regulator [Enterococcus gilvus]
MKQSVLSLLVARQPTFNPALQRVCTYIIENPEIAKTITTKKLAQECDVAESSITRFVQEIGFEKFSQFKISLAEELSQQNNSEDTTNEVLYDDISQDDSTEMTIKKVIYQNIQRIKELESLIQISQIEEAVALIKKAKTLNFVCTGASNVAANEATLRFSRAGKKCILWNDTSMQTISAATATADDLFIGISDSGKTASVLDCLKVAKKKGAATLAITSSSKSPIHSIAELTLLTPTHSSSSRSWESTTSKTSQILLIDILYVCYGLVNFDSTIDSLEATHKALKYTRR